MPISHHHDLMLKDLILLFFQITKSSIKLESFDKSSRIRSQHHEIEDNLNFHNQLKCQISNKDDHFPMKYNQKIEVVCLKLVEEQNITKINKAKCVDL